MAQEHLQVGHFEESAVFSLLFARSRKLKVIDCDEFRDRTEAIELSAFHSTCKRHMDSAREQLAKR